MELEFTRLGMIVCAVVIMCGGVYLAIKSPLFHLVGELLALVFLMFASAFLGLLSSIMTNQILPVFVGALCSAPIVYVCWHRLRHVVKSFRTPPPFWS